MRLIAETIEDAIPHPNKHWDQRIVLGCWAVSPSTHLLLSSLICQAKYLPLCHKYLPTFPISFIGFSTAYARQFLSVPNISFNMLQKVLMGPVGNKFLRDAKAAHRSVLAWTVNDDNMMRWCIKHDLDGVITDDPKRFLEVCDEWEQGKREIKIGRKEIFLTLWLHMMVMIFGVIFRWKYPFRKSLSYKEGKAETIR